MTVLVDTNTVIYASQSAPNGRPAFPNLAQWLSDRKPFVSAVSMDEALRWPRLQYDSKRAERRALLHFFMQAETDGRLLSLTPKIESLAATFAVAPWNIARNDALIAATSADAGCVLVTADVGGNNRLSRLNAVHGVSVVTYPYSDLDLVFGLWLTAGTP